MVTDATIARDAAKVYPRWLDWEGACTYLSTSRDGLYRLVQAGLPASRVGRGQRGQFRFDRLRLDAWMEEHAVHGHNVGRQVA